MKESEQQHLNKHAIPGKKAMRICLKYLFMTFGMANFSCILKICEGKGTRSKQAFYQITPQNASTSSGKKQLQTVLENYPLYQIPRHGTDPLLVNIDVMVSNVIDVDIAKYTFTAVLVLNQSWFNKDLVWDEKEYPFTTITVPWSSIWTPSLTVREACTLSFFSLSNEVNEIEFNVSVQNEILNLKREYLVTGMDITSPRNMPQPYFVVKINIENTGIRAMLSMIVPSLLLVIADLCGFLVPLQDRMAYMVTLLLAYLVFHSSVVGSLPGSSSCNPLLSFYYMGLLVLLFVSTIETILVAKLVSDNIYLWPNCRLRGRKTNVTTRLSKDESYHVQDANDPGKQRFCTNKALSQLNETSAALDRRFFFVYFGLLILFHCIVGALWLFWKCESEKPPGECHLDGISW
ncbi:ligand-gated cation channel ZACN [Anolis sagrei]|uniref:ligand-gated cation channel ZACN n=1 Tax=Anolis sagrei TaxID=38937 RepID=UPI0035201EC1